MNKIIKKSSNSFQLDKVVDSTLEIVERKWFTMDSFKILKNAQNRLKFESLKVGDTVSNIELQKGTDGKDYVTSFSVGSVSSVVDGAHQSNLNSASSPPKLDIGNFPKKDIHCVNKIVLSKYPLYEFRHIPFTCDLCGYMCLDSQSGEDKVLNPLVLKDSFNSLSSLDSKIRFAPCVNLAFNNFSSREVNLAFKMDGKFPMIESAFDLADEIFNEWNKR